MKKRVLLPRKKPLQKRSVQMVRDILKGAIRVLEQQGGRKFTTIQVAKETGISVGSLYQYFPNKESILFQVQQREWETTSGMLLAMITDRRHSPEQRLRRAIPAFFQSEWEEADLRKALMETGIIVEDTQYFIDLRATLFAKMGDLLRELKPGMKHDQRRFAAEFIFTTISSLAEDVTTRARSKTEVRRWALHCTEMILSFLIGGAVSKSDVAAR